MGKKILGVDEAGRGAVVGSMVIGAAVVDEEDEEKLKKMGVKDSKKLTRERREELEKKIKDLAYDFSLEKITAQQIDGLRKIKSLNRIESESMARLINELKPDVAIIDATEVKTDKIERELRAQLDEGIKNEIELIAENKADDNYPVVSAASILAKVTRDNSVSSLEEEMEEVIGNGYPSDQRTKDFLKRILKKNGTFPHCVRKSWITAQRLLGEEKQDDLSNFCN
ncbi:MAG: ribonuclease HII [Candidatus Aenigmatarchaeota archaeon]